MMIRFLRNSKASQKYTRTFCECCGPEPMPAEPTWFIQGQEEDPNVYQHEIDLSGLIYRVDYDIIAYP